MTPTTLTIRRLCANPYLSNRIDGYLFRQFPQMLREQICDIRQEALMAALKSLPGFFDRLKNEDPGISLKSLIKRGENYTLRIAYNKMVDHYRRVKRRPSIPLDRRIGGDKDNSTFLDLLRSEQPMAIEALEAQQYADHIKALLKELDDPNGRFAKVRSRNWPKLDLGWILQQKMAGQTFEAMSQKSGIPSPTISSFWYRKKEKLEAFLG